MSEVKNKIKRQFIGEVVMAANKTVSVKVDIMKKDPKYNKPRVVSKKYPTHDEAEIAKVGDKVLLEECRPLSRTKRWRLISVQDGSASGGKVS